jgi:hypothetical protein
MQYYKPQGISMDKVKKDVGVPKQANVLIFLQSDILAYLRNI